MSGPARLGTAVAAALLVIGCAACGATSAGVPPGPMMSGHPGADGDDGDGGPGGMMGGASTATSVPHTGPIAGEGLDAATVATLQAAVDHGAQPWRLDRQLTALAFARSHLGWMMPRTQLESADTVLVDDGRGGAVSLSLTQPGRTGTGGIWAVTGGTWVR